MAILRSIPSAAYEPQTISESINVPQSATRMTVTLTRESWPAGPVGSMAIYYPDGTLASASTYEGGDQHHPFTGALITEQRETVYGKTLDGVVQDLPKGQFRFDVEILQPLTTAVLIERF